MVSVVFTKTGCTRSSEYSVRRDLKTQYWSVTAAADGDLKFKVKRTSDPFLSLRKSLSLSRVRSLQSQKPERPKTQDPNCLSDLLQTHFSISSPIGKAFRNDQLGSFRSDLGFVYVGVVGVAYANSRRREHLLRIRIIGNTPHQEGNKKTKNNEMVVLFSTRHLEHSCRSSKYDILLLSNT